MAGEHPRLHLETPLGWERSAFFNSWRGFPGRYRSAPRPYRDKNAALDCGNKRQRRTVNRISLDNAHWY